MKLAFGILSFVWLLCGLAGAWRLDELDIHAWKTIAKGPVSLIDSFDENPVTYPGPT